MTPGSPSLNEIDRATTRTSEKCGVAAVAIVVAYILIYLLAPTERALFTPDELRYAEVPREILSTGDWVVPRLAGVRYFEKPPLGYWVNALAQSTFGENRFAVRLPSTLSAGLTALLVFAFTKRWSGRTATGLFAAAVYLSFVEVYVIGTFNVLDGILTLFLTAAIIAFQRAITASKPAEQRRFALAAGAAAGCAFLTKGFLGLAVPAMVLGPWLLGERDLLRTAKLTLIAIVAAGVVVSPWAVEIHLREADFWRYFFWEEHVRRFLADNAQHRQPAYFYLTLLPLLAFPWLAWIPAALVGQRLASRHPHGHSQWRLIGLWIIVPLVFFSVSRGKLITYILPCFPALAIFVAMGLSSYLAEHRRGWLGLGAGINASILLVGVLVALAVFSGAIDPLLFHPSEPGLALFGAALLLGASAGLALLFRASGWQTSGQTSQGRGRVFTASVLVVVPVMLVAPFSVPQSLLEKKAPGLLLEPFASQVDERSVLITDSGTVRAVTWFFKRTDVHLTSSGELTYGFGYPEAAGRLLTDTDLEKIVADHAGSDDLLMICKRSCPIEDVERLPSHASRHAYGRFELWHAAAKPTMAEADGNTQR